MKVMTTQQILDELNGRGPIAEPTRRYTITEEWLQAALHACMTGAEFHLELLYSFLSTARKPNKSDAVKDFQHLWQRAKSSQSEEMI